MSFFEAMFGDDFPDAFAKGDGRSCKSRKTILDLPAELLEAVSRFLSLTEIKQFRLTSRELAEKVDLRIARVYISPNRANLDCLNNILNHPRYHLHVQEIVWDDSQLDKYATLEQFREALESESRKARGALEDRLQTLNQTKNSYDTEYEPISLDECIEEDGGLSIRCKAMLLRSDDPDLIDLIASHAAPMNLEESYVLYQKLYQDEKEIIKRGWDVAALQRALERLPNLQRITLTTDVWRTRASIPTYDTPFFRAIPPGFRKPLVSPWSYSHKRTEIQQFSKAMTQETNCLPAQWRGYSIIMASLIAVPTPHLQEFVVDVGREWLGLPYQLFYMPSLDYDNTLRAMSVTHLRKLQLSLSPVYAWPDCEPDGPSSACPNALRDLLSCLHCLEDLDLAFNDYDVERFSPADDFPEHIYRKLRAFALRNTVVHGSTLFSLISDADKLETVVLDKLLIRLPISGGPVSLRNCFFARLRDHYTRLSYKGPKFTWIQKSFHSGAQNVSRWEVLDHELDAFLYGGGESPWAPDENTENESTFKPGFGWIMDDKDLRFRKTR
jgi:hypothetical protein